MIQNIKLYGVKLGTMEYLGILEEIKKVKKKENLHNYSNISTPHTIRLTQVGVEGVALTVIPSRLFK